MKTRQSTHSRIRWMKREDVSRVLEIEMLCFLDPMPENKLFGVLQDKKTVGVVIESCSDQVAIKDRVVGFCIYKLHPLSIQILTMAIHPDFREQGFASSLIQEVKKKLGSYRFSIYSYLAEDELKGLNFLKRRGFKSTQIVHNLWGDGFDAFRMEYMEKENG